MTQDSAQMTCEASLGTVVGGKWSLELQLLLQYAVTQKRRIERFPHAKTMVLNNQPRYAIS